MIDQASIDRLRASTDIVALVGRSLKLVKRGKDWWGCCAFHKESTPSLKVNRQTGRYHCLSAETMVRTQTGLAPIADLAGKSLPALAGSSTWVEAEFRSYGVQQLFEIRLQRNQQKKTLFATDGHRWLTSRGERLTSTLSPGAKLRHVLPPRANITLNPEGVRHGIVFGDGTALHKRQRSEVALYAGKTELRSWFGEAGYSFCDRGLDAHRIGGLPLTFKHLPEIGAHPDYLAGFIAGLLATDGCVDTKGSVCVHSKNRATLEWVREAASRLGIGTYTITHQMRCGYLDHPTAIYRTLFDRETLPASMIIREAPNQRFTAKAPHHNRLGWVVTSVTQTARREEVFCAEVPGAHSFALEDDILTGNCFGCEADGDVFTWIEKTENCTFPQAVERLSNGHAAPYVAPQREPDVAPAKTQPKPMAIMPVPDDAPGCQFLSPSLGEPTGTWTYRDAAGALLGHVARYDVEGRKVFQPYVWTSKGWRNQGFPDPRPLYGLDALAARFKTPVLVVEGEKSCVAAQALLPDYVCVTWHGGASAVKKTDWSALKGRACVLWPDCDDAGRQAMKHVAKLIGGGRIIEPPAGVEKGWDAADALAEGWDTARVSALLAPPHEPEPVEARGPMPEPEPGPVPDGALEPPAFDPADTAGEWPFQCLGHRQGIYFYLPFSGGTIITLSGAGHTKANFLMLAPMNFWEMKFGIRDNKGWDAGANALIQEQHRRGIFDPTRLRGRGAWWDDKRVVVHLGDRLLVDGQPMPVRELKTDYVYEIGAKIRHAPVKPLANAEAHQLIDLCKLLSWERPISAYLLAGWCALAPICGALSWRPMLAIAGPAGAGKSYLMSKIVAPCLGQFALALASTVTEPGIRRALGFDARPVIVDEFEAKDDFARARLEAIMGLMRYSSCETDAMIVKGSNSGAGVEFFKIRSMFCTAAIGSLINDYADKTRITVVGLKMFAGKEGADRFAAIEDGQRVLTEAWVDGLHSRIMGMIPTIRRNAQVFAVAGAAVLGTRRLGDQLGTLIAGAYALTSRSEITQEAAERWLEQQDWSEEKEITQDTDGPLCYARIMEHQVMCEARQGGSVKRSLGELVGYVLAKHGDEVVSYDTALAILRRHGCIVMDDKRVAVSNTHSALKAILYDSPWAANWNLRLKSIRGAEASKKTLSYGHGAAAKAVLVPHEAAT